MMRTDLFSFPLYKFTFSEHDKNKSTWMRYLTDPVLYQDNTQRETLKFSHPNLHKTELFGGLTDFFDESLKQVMTDLGYKPRIEITGMWATLQDHGGYHHRHTHHNSFLAGVYYLHGTPLNSGTTFYNPDVTHNVIDPAHLPGTNRYFINHHTTRFQEGSLYIFPSWLSHNTIVNNMENTNSKRYIISFNSMPVGPTNADVFDRYNYQSISEAEMIQNVAERLK
jgi:uncharacterized protein (TIGR02466 family)